MPWSVRIAWGVVVGWAMPVFAADPPNPAVAEALTTLGKVGKEGTGNDAAGPAWKTVVSAGPAALLPTLAAIDGNQPIATNWYRSAVSAIVESAKQKNQPLPIADLEAFVKDSKPSPVARRLAFELLRDLDAPRVEKLLPSMIDDPSNPIRRDAIAARLKALGDAKGDPAKDELLTLFNSARDEDQVQELAKKLEPFGQKMDRTRHFGFLTQWQIVGPFDGTGTTGFQKSYPPETGVSLDAEYPGKGGMIRWKPEQSSDVYGTIDLNTAIGKHMDVVAFATATVEVTKETPAEIRVISPNAVQVYLNGTKIYEHEEYHHGTPFDQYKAKGVLKAGRNEILIKLTQNNQTDSWAQRWQFAARVCDATGGKIPLTQIITKDGKAESVVPGALKPVPPKKEGK